MSAPGVERVLWGLALATLGAGFLAAAAAVPRANTVSVALPIVPTAPHRIAPESLAAAARAIAVQDPFRLERKPAAVPYRAALEGMPPPPPAPRPPKPALVLAGIVGGPPWQALIEGLPGRDGAVLLRQGDRIGEFRVRAVGSDTVIVQGQDTIWKLVLKEPWR